MDLSPHSPGWWHLGKGKATGDPAPMLGARPSSTKKGVLTLSTIFLPQGPPLLKQPRSSMVLTMPGMEGYICTSKSHSTFFQDLFVKIAKDKRDQGPFINQDSRILIDIVVSIDKNYKLAVDSQIENIKFLAQEIVTL